VEVVLCEKWQLVKKRGEGEAYQMMATRAYRR
jgi:hypothetical protein